MALRNAEPAPAPEADVDYLTGRGDPQQRFRIYRLCACGKCEGTGRDMETLDPLTAHVDRCSTCRGEGKTLECVATTGTAEGVGTAIIQMAMEGEFEDCPLGILEDGGSWLVKPWLPSPRNVSDAGRALGQASGRKRRETT